MKKSRFIWLALAFPVLLLGACSDDNGGGGGQGPDVPGTGDVNGVMKDLLLTGHVRDTDGNPVAGVSVSSGTSVAVTNASGLFSFSKIDVVENRSVVRFAKDGYFDVVRSWETADGETWDVVICAKNDGEISSTTTYSSSTGQEIEAGGMKIDMPEDGYMVDASGKPYTGQVKADMVYLDPNNENFSEMMPGGDMAATRTDGSDAMLVSYGMTAVNMTDAEGNKLQLKEGSSATLTFPVPEGMTDNLPESIPLWSFNEKNGLWEEEGSAILQGNVYVGKVKHFSWVNLDKPEDRATVKGYVHDEKGNPIGGVRVTVGQTSMAKSNSMGYYECEVPAETAMELKVKPDFYGFYKNVFARPITPLEPQEERTVNITLPRLYNVYGRVVNNGGGSNTASVWMEFGSNMRNTMSVTSDKDGKFSLRSPEGYKGAATLMVRTVEGDIVSTPIVVSGTDDLNVGDIIISSEVGSGGTVDIKLSDGSSVKMEVPNAGPNEGVMVVDDELLYSSETDDGSGVYIDINGYSDSKADYDNVSVGIYDESKGEQLGSYGSSKAKVTRKGGMFVFDINGVASYVNETNDLYDDNASFSSKGLALDMLLVGKTLRGIVPTKNGFPSFTPELSAPAPLALLMSECKLCNAGGIVLYNGGQAEYEALKTAARKAGLKLVAEESDDGGYSSAYFNYGDKYVIVDLDVNVPDVDADSDIFEDEAQLMVTVLDGADETIFDSWSKDGSVVFNVSAKRAVKALRHAARR